MNYTTLRLYKENFKFSAAHFLIFDEKTAEKLHGHNYQVQIEIDVPDDESLGQLGFFIDFNEFKKYIREKLEKWDEIVLLPQKHPDIQVTENGPSLELRFRDRFYVFPKNEVCLLPILNTSVEQLSQLLAQDFYKEFHTKWHVRGVQVSVEETRGQAAVTFVGEAKR